MKFRSIKGTKDILPDEVAAWQHVESTVRRVMHAFNYKEIRTPVFEQTSLFARSIGELTDIVSKEMYTFLDRSEESITLRPEGTASALRAYIQNNLGEQNPLVKVYYIGPMFRQERPQAGRLRQFHQFGAESLGGSSPQLDVEMMLLPLEIYRQLGIDQFALKINSVGCEKCRPIYKTILQTELKKVFDQLSHDSQLRVENNPLRVLDSKDENDKQLTAHAPLIKDYLCDECKNHFVTVRSLLDGAGIKYEIDGRLVRGLDYYTKTAFEITSTALGSQDALAGGGRYDILVEELGGKSTPGVGFAAGIERLLIVLTKLEKNTAIATTPKIFLIGLDEPSRQWAFLKAQELRRSGIGAEIDYLARSIKAQMREANRQQAEYVVVVGESELNSKSAKLKHMQTGEETEVSLDSLEQSLR
ncbi:MAG TPA: histidine--tRNA ligase [Bacteroidota bacterium]|nr:histidine--tRNA ligase [Bacteroidota bacterium]